MYHSKIILASASPRRAELLRRAGIGFEVHVSPHPEPSRKPAGIPVELWPMCLAYIKARAVQKARQQKVGGIILAADTIVVEGSRILNKPRDRAHARAMLKSLAGKTHRVITGICLMEARGESVRLATAEATCRIRLNARSLEAYVATNLWKGKAGAYGIQDDHDPFVKLLAGDMETVIGLPTALVRRELAAFSRD